MLKSQLSTRGKKWHLGEITTRKKKPKTKRCNLLPQCPSSTQMPALKTCMYAAAKRKKCKNIPFSPWGQSTVSSCLKEELFPNRWSGCLAFHLQGGDGTISCSQLLSGKFVVVFFFPRAHYSWKPSMGASGCWKMNCCWFSSTCGARVESSSTPK